MRVATTASWRRRSACERTRTNGRIHRCNDDDRHRGAARRLWGRRGVLAGSKEPDFYLEGVLFDPTSTSLTEPATWMSSRLPDRCISNRWGDMHPLRRSGP